MSVSFLFKRFKSLYYYYACAHKTRGNVLSNYSVSLRAGKLRPNVYLALDERGMFRTVPQFRNALTVDHFEQARDILSMLERMDPREMRKLLKVDSSFDTTVSISIQYNTGFNTDQQIKSACKMQLMYRFVKAMEF